MGLLEGATSFFLSGSSVGVGAAVEGREFSPFLPPLEEAGLPGLAGMFGRCFSIIPTTWSLEEGYQVIYKHENQTL